MGFWATDLHTLGAQVGLFIWGFPRLGVPSWGPYYKGLWVDIRVSHIFANLHMGVHENMRKPEIEPKIVGSPCDKNPNNVLLISETPETLTLNPRP